MILTNQKGRIYSFCLLAGFLFLSSMKLSAQLTITCPADITDVNDPGLCSAIVTFSEPVGSGSGTGITTTQTTGLTPGSAFPVGTTTVTYTVTNNEGDSESCSFDVTISDNEDPVFDCPDDIIAFADPITCEAIVNFPDPDATDNCNVASITQIGGLPSGSSFSIGENFIDYQVADDAGNLGFCRFKIIVEDVSDPEIICPTDISVDVFNSCDTILNYVAPVGTDNCSPSTTTLIGGLGSGGNFPLGTTIEEYQVTDLAGNTSSCSFSITVNDGAPPEIICPADIVTLVDPGTCEAVVSFSDATATDNCPGSVSISQTVGDPSGSTFPIGTSTIEFTATDVAGNSSTCTFSITVEENIPPEITCPSDITVSSDPGVCEAIVSYTPPTGTDNCPGASTNLISGIGAGGTFPVGTTTETYTVTDLSGNTASCSFDVIVEDTELPVITCPADIIVSASPGLCDVVVSFPDATATDNCPGVSVTQTDGLPTGSSFPVGTTAIEFTAEDAAGNIQTCTFNITVEDDEPPTITCPADVVFDIPGGNCSSVVTYPDPVVTDNCPGSTFSVLSGPTSGDILAAGNYSVELEAIDAAGNTSTCSFNISVTETSVPDFNCPIDLVVPTDNGSCDAVVTFPQPIATDSCSTVSVSQTAGPVSGSSFPLGITAIEFTAEDEFGNTATCSFNIVVEDQELPVISCPADITISTDPGLCEAIVNFPDATASDNCPGVTVSQTGGPLSGSAFPAGTTPVEFTAEDAAGNIASCGFNVIVEDNEAPLITCPADISTNIPAGICSEQINYPDPTISDNCPGSTFSVISGPNSGDILNAGNYTVELEALDASGNTASCTFNISISETSLPVFDCPADLIVPTDPGACDAEVTFPNPSAVDSCSSVTVVQTSGLSSGSTFPIGSSPVEFTAEDEFGNTAVCTFNIIVEDQELPLVSCPADIIVPADPGLCEAIVNFSDATASDNCPGVTVMQTGGPSSGSNFPVGTTQVEFTAEDGSGNTATCTFNITVEDTENPVIACPADIILAIPDGDCSTEITYPDPTISDNCPGVNFTVVSGPVSGEIVNAGDYTVELEAIDAAGNTAVCSFNIQISETSIPVFDCPEDLVVPADPGSCEAEVSFPNPTAVDSCSAVTVSQTGGPVSGSTFPAGNTTVEFTALDAFGNSATCSFDIIVQDDSNPTIDCPENITANSEPGLCGATINYPAPDTDDNCGVASVNQTEGLGSGSFFPVGVTTETYEVIDISGNSSTCSFTITVQDNEPPTITCPADINQVLPDGDCTATINYSAPVAADNCGVNAITLVGGLASGDDFPTGTTTVTFEVEDLSGNSATCSFDITLTENVPPEIICPANIEVDNDPGICGAVVIYTPPVGTDDCPNPVTSLSSGLGSGAEFPVGVNTETYEVIDASGNSVTCSFTITVNDVEQPLISCPENISVSNDAGSCSTEVDYDLPTAIDNCDGSIVPVLTEGLPPGSNFPVGITNVSYESTDVAGNPSTCTFTVEVIDAEAPEITCPADIVVDAVSGDCEATVNYADPTTSDNCPGVTLQLIDGLPSGSDFPVGTTDVTFEATDASGNTAQCTFTITIVEDVPPEITCPTDINIDSDPGNCGATVNYTEPEGTDNCGGATTSLTAGLPSGSEFPVGTTTVSFEVTDISGNTASCSFDVTVSDMEAPVFDCPEQIELSTDPGVCGATYNFNPPSAQDNCTDNLVITQTEGPASGSVLPLGSTQFSFETEDEFGNTSTCTYSVVVSDDSAPTFTVCPADSAVEIAEGSCEAIVNFEEPEATDNCSVVVSQSQGPANGATLAPGTYAYIFQAIDDAGNVSICEFSIEVIDAIAPEITCPESFESCNTQPEFDFATATDNCEVANIVQTAGPSSGDNFPIGETTIEFQATDVNGNTSSCSFVITVLEEAPRAEAGADQNICDSTSTTLFGNDPNNAMGTWLLINGTGNIENPNSQQTDVTGLSEGVNSFIWELDPQNGCDIERDTVNVIVEADVLVDAGEDQLIFSGNSTIIDALISPDGGEIEWSPPDGLSCLDCEDPVANPDENTYYFITYTTELGCEKTDSVLISVFRELPNTITPDGDGVNDVWNIPEIDNYPDVTVLIYNRWGNEVFSSQGYQEPWDGTQNGNDLPTGSYFYIIDYGEGSKENLNGSVNIIR